MSKTIAINAGSSSLKWQLYQMPEETVLAQGIIERIGLENSISTVKFNGQKEEDITDIPDHSTAVKILLNDLIHLGIIASYDEITGVGHRIVAGGEYFTDSVLVDEKVVERVEELAALAPLHNPGAAAGIRAFREILPDITSVCVFDNAYHMTMQQHTYLYPIPQKYYTEHKVRKYGAHGTSHKYVANEAAKMLNRPVEELKIITAHIGNGVSITANYHGESVDTSMGFTPLAGPMMGTRSGDIDPAIIPYIIERDPELKDAADAVNMLNKKSGLGGVSGISSDMRDIEAGLQEHNPEAVLAYNMFIDRIKKYIGQYFAVLNGADVLVFTAGMGENAPLMRQDVIAGMSWFGMELDTEKNVFGYRGEISTPDSKVKVLVISTDEELCIARDVERLRQK
ncbi:acetate kinase [Streptococcus parauberis]|uniref:Acetate kinase n=2 Tax=Streptococcus parauberis TaxID=1348 RepID=A0A0E2UAV9_9STRE|nr:acetate kinase [Streptococcus parauberis]AEF26030.1 acetate kinase [Streptococcus parauberis KCTC 11537]AUT05149.1 Acetate kinase [Streptococcus parauberis]EMG24635.1 Acetate kinase [Streptococcus parauberis KRS-02083]MDT2731908.1 acetate kinase [Streptococcus parauberis]ONH63725.1 Acetate kinase [Streptococcus parauberis]